MRLRDGVVHRRAENVDTLVGCGPPIKRDTLLPEANTQVLTSDNLSIGINVGDGTNRCWTFPLPPRVNAVSVYASTLATGPVNVRMSSGSFFGDAPSKQAMQTLGALVMYQLLMQIVQTLQWLKEGTGSHPPSGASQEFTSGVIRLPQ